MIALLPRLPAAAADNILDEFLLHGKGCQKRLDTNNLPDGVRFAATGGSRSSPKVLLDLRRGINKIAVSCGFGSGRGKREHARFDSDASAWLAENEILASGEGLRDDVWTFFGVAMAPDIVYWRFGAARERYLGGVRNAFQRLWMRGQVLDRGYNAAGRWNLLQSLTEDALVQITERPSIGSDPILARQVAEAWVRAAERYGKGRMEPIMRHATLRIRIQNEIRSLSSLTQANLGRILDSFFEIAEKSVTSSRHSKPGA